jgi:hypothetical protein
MVVVEDHWDLSWIFWTVEPVGKLVHHVRRLPQKIGLGQRHPIQTSSSWYEVVQLK